MAMSTACEACRGPNAVFRSNADVDLCDACYDSYRAEEAEVEVKRLRARLAVAEAALEGVAGGVVAEALCASPTRALEHGMTICPACCARMALGGKGYGLAALLAARTGVE